MTRLSGRATKFVLRLPLLDTNCCVGEDDYRDRYEEHKHCQQQQHFPLPL